MTSTQDFIDDYSEIVPNQKQKLNFTYDINHKSDSYTRNSTITFAGGRKAETPIMWIGLSVAESKEHQENLFSEANAEAFLSNAYDLLYQDKNRRRHDLIESLTKQGLLHKCDSGGFQLMKKPDLQLSQTQVFEKQKEIDPDIYVQLDCPLGVSDDKADNLKRINMTLDNMNTLLKEDISNRTILPVVHGHDVEMLEYCITKLENMVESIPLVGIGSLVPKLHAVPGSAKVGGKWKVLELILYLRERLPNTLIHTFGVGGTMAYLCVLAGVDSYDSNGWVQKAAVEAIQLPGISDRFLCKKPHNRPYLISDRKRKDGTVIDEKAMFMTCNCPACVEYNPTNWGENDFERKINDFMGRNAFNRYLRELHNMWVFQNELYLMRNAIKYNKINEFVTQRLKNSVFLKQAEVVLDWKNGNRESLYKQLGYESNQSKSKHKRLDEFI